MLDKFRVALIFKRFPGYAENETIDPSGSWVSSWINSKIDTIRFTQRGQSTDPRVYVLCTKAGAIRERGRRARKLGKLPCFYQCRRGTEIIANNVLGVNPPVAVHPPPNNGRHISSGIRYTLDFPPNRTARRFLIRPRPIAKGSARSSRVFYWTPATSRRHWHGFDRIVFEKRKTTTKHTDFPKLLFYSNKNLLYLRV